MGGDAAGFTSRDEAEKMTAAANGQVTTWNELFAKTE